MLFLKFLRSISLLAMCFSISLYSMMRHGNNMIYPQGQIVENQRNWQVGVPQRIEEQLVGNQFQFASQHGEREESLRSEYADISQQLRQPKLWSNIIVSMGCGLVIRILPFLFSMTICALLGFGLYYDVQRVINSYSFLIHYVSNQSFLQNFINKLPQSVHDNVKDKSR